MCTPNVAKLKSSAAARSILKAILSSFLRSLYTGYSSSRQPRVERKETISSATQSWYGHHGPPSADSKRPACFQDRTSLSICSCLAAAPSSLSQSSKATAQIRLSSLSSTRSIFQHCLVFLLFIWTLSSARASTMLGLRNPTGRESLMSTNKGTTGSWSYRLSSVVERAYAGGAVGENGPAGRTTLSQASKTGASVQ
jgi:hypothetical protein